MNMDLFKNTFTLDPLLFELPAFKTLLSAVCIATLGTQGWYRHYKVIYIQSIS